MSLVKRRIDVTITLGTGTFGETVGSTMTLQNHRVIADMQTMGGDAKGEIMLAIYGLPLKTMNQLTTIGSIMASIRGKNTVSVDAGDDGAALTNIFQGEIIEAWCDLSGVPDAPLIINAKSAQVADLKPVTPSSYKGSADVATVMGALAKQMNLTLENNGVKATLQNPYFSGSAFQQVQACARAADITAYVDRDKLVIIPKDGYRAGNVPLISKDTGMKGYPKYSSAGLIVTTMFHPDIVIGGRVNIQSSMTPACGVWVAIAVSHHLEALKPGGKWDTDIACLRAPT